jgi:hypothetical protein
MTGADTALIHRARALRALAPVPAEHLRGGPAVKPPRRLGRLP